jgi:hypothetical protein
MHVEGIGKSGCMGQSRLFALRRFGLRDGDDSGDPLAPGELDHIPPHLLDLRDRSCWTKYTDCCIRAGFGYGGLGDSRFRSFPDFPFRCHTVYSSSTCVLIPRSIQ